jgi:putative ABC transport system permease protein
VIRHLLKLVWNRKRTNLLIVAEILCSFLVVFSLSAWALYLGQRYRDPLGFEYRDVWQVDVARNTAQDWGTWSAEDAATFRDLLRALEGLEPVVAVSGANTAPYKGSVHIMTWDIDGERFEPEVSAVTPELRDVLGLELVAGRWLQPEDSALDWRPVVVDEELARQLVGDGDPLGKRVGGSSERDDRVVGVVRDYRRGGELDANVPYAFYSANLERDDGAVLGVILLRLAPGTPADFEATLMRTLQAVAHGWSFNVGQLETARERHLREKLIPLASIGLVAGFLLLMVVLGLTGVMWQNVTRRTREIGLRRATGAHRARIQRQIVGEVLVTAALGLAAGALIVIQVPLVGPFTFVPYGVVVPALLVSALLILGLAGLCGWYPGWSATRIQPAEALHYE